MVSENAKGENHLQRCVAVKTTPTEIFNSSIVSSQARFSFRRRRHEVPEHREKLPAARRRSLVLQSRPLQARPRHYLD